MRRVALIVLAATVTSGAAHAQAWVPPAGSGAVTAVVQAIENTGHLLTDGTEIGGYDSESVGVLLEVDYAFTDRFSISLGVPYIFARYTGPEPSFSGLPVDECHCWNEGFQDFGVTLRYNLINGTSALTPFVALGIPSHDYNYFGEAVLGRNLEEMRLGVAAGQRLDFISPRLSIQGRYAYAIVEEVLGLDNDRSNFSIEPAFQITRKLFARGIFAWQRSHGGLRGTEFTTENEWLQFDRLLRDDYFHAGAAISWSLPRVDVFAAYINYVSGRDTHAGGALTVGVSWPFTVGD